MKKEFVRNPFGENYVLTLSKSTFISYNPCPSILPDNGSSETAIVRTIKSGKKFYILNGDFRKEYQKLSSKGVMACIKFFKTKSKLKSSWSD